MPASSTANPQVPHRLAAYEGFTGLDTSRDISAMDTGRSQALVFLENGTCDARGQIEPDPPAVFVDGLLPVRHVRHLSRDIVTWAEATQLSLDLTATTGHSLARAYPRDAVLASAVFGRRVHYFSRGLPSFVYDGAIWRPNPSRLYAQADTPAFGCAVSRRLCVAGFANNETRIEISQVDREDLFVADTPGTENSVLRAGFIDIANILNTGDFITGLAQFEQDRLAVFTQDRVLVYIVTPEINNWQLDSRINIQVGCLSHNTIAQAGNDLIFCSRAGVHSFRRSVDNGITITTTSLAASVERLYREFVRSTPNPEEISAVFDRDEELYHIFFPTTDGIRRLTLAMPTTEQEAPRWSTGNFLQASCGGFLAGSMIYGTAEGIFQTLRREQEGVTVFEPEVAFETPLLWHGDFVNDKEAQGIIIQAAGAGFLAFDAVDEKGRIFHSDGFEIEPDADDSLFAGVPLSRRYERRFEHRYRAMRLRFRMTGRGQLRFAGFAIRLKRG